MSKIEKLLDRLDRCDPNLSFEELEIILNYVGYSGSTPKGGSSHYTFRRKGSPPITIPKHKSIGRSYIRAVRDMIRKDGDDE